VQIAPVFDPTGKLNSVVALFHDISDFKQFEKMRSEFVANVSHELKTPLTSIRGFTETLKQGGIDDRSKALHFLEIIELQTLRLEKLVADVLTLASIEAQSSNYVVLMRTDQSLSSLLRELIVLQQPDILARQHELDIDIPEDLPHVLGVQSELEVVFLNLLNNAIKFTPQQGHIGVRAYEDEGMVRVDIKDNGLGIAPEHQKRLFERFYRVDKARSQNMGGTGLGLSIVKHIVLAHQGRVELSSSAGRGSIFSVFLPKA
jgi:two-component system phosphate regulon sensor histidine kinase PhoR